MIQVAFAGHNRPDDLGHHDPVIESLETAFAILKDAGVGEARLLTGLAEGADALAAAAWRRAGFGPVQAVYPFLDDQPPSHCGGCADVATWLDGAATEAAGRNAHLKQAKLIVEAGDLLVCVWTGERARGPGGTADAVRTALLRGIPILWIKPAELGVRLIRPETLPADIYFLEFQEALQAERLSQVVAATPEALAAALHIEPAAPPEPPAPSGWPARFDDWLHGWLWQTYRHFHNLMGGRVSMDFDPPPPPPDLAAQPGFQRLTAAYDRADRLASKLAAVHRSEQILLVMVMIVAAVIGSAWAIWPGIKLYAVWAELILGVAALMIWSIASDSRQHERWGLQRYLAEQLRMSRAGWTLGVTPPFSSGDPTQRESDLGVGVRRSAGLPVGRYDADRARTWGDWAMGELIQGQSAYHRAISSRDQRIAHRIHLVEDVSFLILFILFVAYVSLYSAQTHPPEWFSGVVSMTGVVVPALAAAAMALEAKLEFSEQSNRSKRIAESLDALASRMGPAPSWEAVQSAAREAMAIHMADASHWREGAGRRRLLRP